MKRRVLFLITAVAVIVLVGIGMYVLQIKSPRAPLAEVAGATDVNWQLGKDNVWVATGTPPPCPKPLVLTTPVELSKVTAILYPGQPRGGAWKPHGAFRFNQKSNKVTVKVPFDAKVIRGAHLVIDGENQYAFEFVAPCGVFYSFGHMLELSPKFQAMADKLPVIKGFAKQQFFDVTPPVTVKQGEIIATAVGYAKTKNVMLDWGVLDLRHKNGAKLRPAWAKYANEFDQYAVCWLDYLPVADAKYLRGLFGSGDAETGTKSDYCHYPQNK